MKKWFNNLKKKFARWLLKEQIEKLELSQQKYDSLLRDQSNIYKKQVDLVKELQDKLGNIGVGVDVDPHPYSHSWAVICLQGNKRDFIKFVELNDSNVHEIQRFLSNFRRDNVNIDLPIDMPKNIFFRI